MVRFAATVVVTAFGAAAAPTPSASDLASASPPTVGMEGRLERALPGTLLQAKPVNERTLVVLRIADTRPHGTLTWYDLRYMGLVPGEYDLRDYLQRADGGSTADLPALPVRIVGLLPDPHSGELVEASSGGVSIFGRHRVLLWGAAGLWAVAGVALLALRRQPPKAAQAVEVDRPVSLANRLRPLIEQAADGRLSSEGKAQLERLLLAHWRERLDLRALSYAEAMPRLREHPGAGVLLRQLEDWLHRPPGSAQVDVAALLAPYRSLDEGPLSASPDPAPARPRRGPSVTGHPPPTPDP